MSDTQKATNEQRKATPDQIARFERMVANVLMSRAQLLQKFIDPRRDLDDECGYPKRGTPIDIRVYQELFDREPIPNRVTEVLPKESWQVQPSVYESDDPDVVTEFEEAWDSLAESLRGDSSYYQDEEGSVVWEYLKRVDIQSGIGQYGVLLLGIDDGKELAEPADLLPPGKGKGAAKRKKRGSSTDTDNPTPPSDSAVKAPKSNPAKPTRKLLFLRVFPQSMAAITRFDSDPSSPRFGQPDEYEITLNDPRTNHGGIGLTTATQKVHWSRVIHIADNLSSSEIFGVPRQEPVLNRLLDLCKMYGGSAEMYWRGAFPGLSLETHPQLGGDVNVPQTELRDMMEDYSNGLQRYISLTGMAAKSLAPQVVDPTQQILVQIEAICIKLGIPKRIFMGTERGELASSQDDKAWNDRIRERQNGYITPRMVVPLVDRLIALGILPVPEGYSVWWPDLTSQTDGEKADTAVKLTTALANYISCDGQTLIPPMDFLTRFMMMTDEEAEAVLERVSKMLEDASAEMDKFDANNPEPDPATIPGQNPTNPNPTVPGSSRPPVPAKKQPMTRAEILASFGRPTANTEVSRRTTQVETE